MRTLEPALSLEAEENMARAADDICRAWLAYENVRTGPYWHNLREPDSARLKAAAQSLEHDWLQARHGYKWEDYCEPAMLKELRRLEKI